MTRSTRVLPLVVAAVLSVIPSANAINWSLSSSSCDGSPFKSLNAAVTCNGSSSCGLGDTATVAGTLTATDDFENSDVTLKLCVVGYCPEIAQKGGGKICDDWLTPTDGQDCGEAGQYSISHTEEIPDEEEIPSGFWWFVKSAVGVKMIVGSEEECGAQADPITGIVPAEVSGTSSVVNPEEHVDADEYSGLEDYLNENGIDIGDLLGENGIESYDESAGIHNAVPSMLLIVAVALVQYILLF